MIEKINNIKRNNYPVFKSSIMRQERADIEYNIQKEGQKKTVKMDLIAGAIGLGAGLIGIANGKNNKKSAEFGILTFLYSSIVLNLISGIKDIKESKEFYKKYEDENKYNNNFDKFVSSISTPQKIDLENEEKNKEYYKEKKTRTNGRNKIQLNSNGNIGSNKCRCYCGCMLYKKITG